MPIKLSPLSRRGFLKRSLLAGAGLALAPELFAAKRRTNPDSWVFFSDTHIAADATKVARNTNMSENFRKAAAEVLALPETPAGFFHTGDCAYNSGEAADYVQFASLLEPLRAGGYPLHLTMGNHDDREHFWAALPKKDAAKRIFNDRQMALIKSPSVHWYMLDSLETTLQTPGVVGERQLKWLAKSLDANPTKPAVILVHHNPGSGENNSGLKDTTALLELLRPRRQVKAWVFGHTHNWSITQDESGLHLVNLPPVAYIFKEGQPAGWVHATTRNDGMKLELRCLDTAHPSQGQIVDLKWREA